MHETGRLLRSRCARVRVKRTAAAKHQRSRRCHTIQLFIRALDLGLLSLDHFKALRGAVHWDQA